MYLKLVTSVTALLLVIQSHAANYYFAASGNDSYTIAQAQKSATPWKTLTKLNSFFNSIKPGDSILFKRGDTFTGTININRSGAPGKPIVISAYGAGARPIITALVPVTNWVNLGGGIWQASCPQVVSSLNIVMLNGAPQPLGRYPNANAANGGYLNVDSHVGNTQITSSQLNTSVNWAGATVAIRKLHWVLTGGTIISNTANTITYTDVNTITPSNNFGFFIQNHPKTLDQSGEWYFDKVNKKLSMYWGTKTPGTSVVSVSAFDYIINMTGYNYISVDGLNFTGGNINNINLFTTNGFQIKNCSFTSCGGICILANLTTDLLVTQCNLLNSANGGIQNNSGTNTQITYDTLKNTGIVAGMGMTANGSSDEGILAVGTNGLVANNSITNTGSNGIDFGGEYNTIKNNFVNNFSLVKDDGGGIYTNVGGTDTVTVKRGMSIVGNIVINSVGAPAGTTGIFPGCASGIYLDQNSSGITITGNTLASTVSGIFFHNNRNMTVSGNTFYNNQYQVVFSHNDATVSMKNNNFNNNIAFSVYKNQPTLYFITVKNDIKLFGVFNNNYYSNPIDNVFPINASGNLLDLSLWQYTFGKDLTSFNAQAIPCYTVSMPSKKTLFTNSTFSKNITGTVSYSVNGNFKSAWDNSGMLDGGAVKTNFSFISGSYDSPLLLCNVGAVTASKVYSLKFSMNSNKANRKLLIYFRNTNSPYNTISEIKYINIANKRTENTIMLVPTVSTSNATIVFAFQDEDVTAWFDNVNLYTTTSQLNDPTQNILFTYNATAKSKTIKLASSYVDVKNKPYKTSATIAPFSSLILIKNQDTLATLPPVVYIDPHTPKTSLNDVAFADSIRSKPQVNSRISVFPNPSTDHFMFNFDNQNVHDLSIQVMNTNGDIILTQKVLVTDNNYQLNFSKKPLPGCYYIHLSGANINETKKVIIM